MSNSYITPELSQGERDSVLYHDIFDYPINFSDLIKWKSGKQFSIANFFPSEGKQFSVTNKRGYYFLKGREGLIYKRLLRIRISDKKTKIAEKASKLLSFTSGIRAIGLTGSLSMKNSSEESDIDLFFITKRGKLWTTRILCYLVLWLNGYKIRKPNSNKQKDRLCLNMWIDESDLVWPKNDRNLYTAHEIAQIVPLVNKENTFEKFLGLNKWILDYWPNSVKIKEKLRAKSEELKAFPSSFFLFPLIQIERLAFKLQYLHMKSKISREVVTPTRAIFHPQDLSKKVLERFS